jgi:hypothetical protein
MKALACLKYDTEEDIEHQLRVAEIEGKCLHGILVMVGSCDYKKERC